MEKTFRFLSFLFLCMWGLMYPVSAQYDPETAENLAFRKSGLAFGGNVGLRGIGVDVQYFNRIDDLKEWTIAFRFASVTDGRELRIPSLYSDQGGKDFIFDKANYVYNLTLLYGWQFTLTPLNPYNQLSVRAGVAIGPSLAILKPYYVDIAVPVSPGSSAAEIQSVPYDHRNVKFSDIVGEANFTLGTDQLGFTPGITLRTNVMFNLGKSQARIRALNIGVDTHVFFSPLRIMDVNANRNVHVNGFISFIFGSLQ